MKIKELHARFLKCSSASTDTRKITPNAMFFALKGENFNGNTYAEQAIKQGAKYVVIDEKEYMHSSKTILVSNVLETLQQLATFHREYLKTPIIALTGSNGKTTTKELINAVLSKKYKTSATKGNLNNHIGVPLTLLSMTKETELGIVEMGANHQKEIEFLSNIVKPDYGLITNYGKAHLEGFGGVEGIIKGKSELYTHLIEYDKLAFINGLDPIQIEKSKKAKTYKFGNTSDFDVEIHFIEAQPYVFINYQNQIIKSQLIGSYNFTNIAIAITIGAFFKVQLRDIKEGIESYVPSNNRSQVLIKASNKIILDAYNANPTSMKAALENFEKQSGDKIAILGDMFELGEDAPKEHQYIADLASKMPFNQIVLIGSNFYKIKAQSENTTKFESFEDFKANFLLSNIKNSTLLIKGSRGMALERIMDIL
ncbi:UDP-N-acetylmuramoyl-tripeptide--D-alanyl-D-alanine ligase [Yeosuana marina]|uniref:UDP-N-acetylmuramoyl-tripeptide--D-alanyl-D- alanine ligase n=1 Tax=Yeosuana marina TaxID=1565536 RepID=UPI0014234900|nr:UDP-N-acetylmuramoyl-tripeptide--D-alanyl-D-alanine ligase [Yeosuana marina]